MHTTIAVQLNLWGNPCEGTLVMVEDAQERAACGGCGEAARAPQRALHAHSLAARDHHQDAHKGRKQLIVDCLVVKGKPMTDRQIRDAICHGGDMNTVRPRITELLKEGKLVDCGEIEDAATGEQVRVVWLA
jgi:hypothetical protein